MSLPVAPLLRADGLVHHCTALGELRGVSLGIETAVFTLIRGEAGSGAALLLRVLGLLDRADAGELWLAGRALTALDETTRLALRNHTFGFVFAEPFLLDSFSVAENVAMPLFKISGLDIEQARIRTAQVLDFVELADAADCAMNELSAMDHHKVALARALAHAPQILIAEDAGLQLNTDELRAYAALLRSAPDQLGVSVIATSPAGSDVFNPDREIRIENGMIAADSNPLPFQEAPTQ